MSSAPEVTGPGACARAGGRPPVGGGLYGDADGATVAGSPVVRVMWFAVGWVNVGIGGVGIVVPGLPTTVFFIAAAYSFSRSSPRFERWVLGLPKIGPMVADYRAGLGMPKRVKLIAIGTVVVFGSISVVTVSQKPWLSGLIAGLCLIGILYITLAIPLRERVLQERANAIAAQMWVTHELGSPTVVIRHVLSGFAVQADRAEQLDPVAMSTALAAASTDARASDVERRFSTNTSKDLPEPE